MINAALTTAYETLEKKCDEQAIEINVLKLEIIVLKKIVFGGRQEKFKPNPNATDVQLPLFTDDALAEVVVESTKFIPGREVKKTAVRVNHPGRHPLPDHLRRVQIILEPEEDVSMLTPIGEQITEVLEYKQAELFVTKYVRRKYLRQSEDGLNAKSIIAEVPSLPIPKSYVSASLLANFMVSKFVDHLPIYRQLQILFTRHKVQIPDSTIVGWVKEGCKLLQPLFKLYEHQILATNYLNVDETTIKVLDKSKKGTTHKGYFWVFYNTIDKTVLFKYDASRSGKCPRATLEGFKGYLHADGYNVYENFEYDQGITLVNCWAHARRKFIEARSFDEAKCDTVLTEIQQLYLIEKHCREQKLQPQAIQRYRQLHAKPILDGLYTILVEMSVNAVPKSTLGKALQYTLKRWKNLNVYITDGNLTIDNNCVENSIRPVAVGRKNYLFAGSERAAHNSAMLYSFFATCKLYNVNPIEWLTHVLENINDTKMTALHNLLPQNYVAKV